jgi:site-specific DNA-methyltransferase (adenine-specific)
VNPYYQDDAVTIYHGDCREILPSMSADVMITDPPYGVGIDRTFDDDFEVGLWGVEHCPGDRAAVFHSPRAVVDLIRRVESWRIERLLWMNKIAMMKMPWRGWNMNGEVIVIASRTRQGWPDPPHYGSDCYQANPWGKNGHPCNKPPSVVTDLIAKLSLPGDVVIDPFVGSGTTLRSARDLGRKAIGIEVEERYCEMAARRLDQGVMDFGGAA